MAYYKVKSEVWLCNKTKDVAECGSAEKSLRAHNLLEGIAGSQGMEVAVASERVEELIIRSISRNGSRVIIVGYIVA